jgi:hypothetical protein
LIKNNRDKKESKDKMLNLLSKMIEDGKKEGKQKYAIDGCILSLDEMKTLQQKALLSISLDIFVFT